MPPDAVLAQSYQCLSQPGGAHGQACGISFAPYPGKDVHRARLTPRSRGPLGHGMPVLWICLKAVTGQK